MSAPRTEDNSPFARDLYLLLAAATLAAGPHLLRIAPWSALAFLVTCVWRAGAVRFDWPLPGPGRWHLVALKYLLASGLFLTALATPGGFGRDAGVNLLVGLMGLKLVELRTLRDFHLAAVLLLFLLVTGFFYAQTPLTAVHMLLTVLTVLVALAGAHDPERLLGLTARLRLAGLVLAQALPILLAAYVLFPRLNGPLWGLPHDALSGQSGLSDTMTPGSISELTLSDAVVFRASFEGEAPPPKSRYWRGPVLWNSDGRSWRPEPRIDAEPAPDFMPGPARYRYTLTLEPQRNTWIYLLDLPTVVPAGANVARDFVARWKRPIQTRLQFSAESATSFRASELSPLELQLALGLPPGTHGRTRALAASWRSEGLAGAALVERALGHFRTEPFFYTLTPPLPEGDPIDDFLFDSRRGFCEHYAAAFVMLMRAAGLPARVVTGYQGGEWNAIGGYWVVRSRDAHAWAEVWLKESGWTRVDPTAAVAPERIERGVTEAVPALAGALDGVPGVADFWFRIDALQNAWNQWVLGYDQSRQRLLLDRLGMPDVDLGRLSVTLAATVCGLLLLLGGIWWWAASRASRPRDLARRLFLDLARFHARRGFPHPAHEPPVSYLERLAAEQPARAPMLRRFAQLYGMARYGGRTVPATVLREAARAARG